MDAVFGEGVVEEWFQYGGEPYHFKVQTSTINSTDEMIQQLTELIGTMQNVRSHLDSVIVEAVQQLHLYNGCIIETVADSVTIGIDMNV